MTQGKQRANSTITTHVRESDGVIEFTVLRAGSVGEHGQATNVVIELDPGKLSEANRKRAMVHGLIQRVSDKAAMSRDPATGKPASPGDKARAMRQLVEHLVSGSEAWAPEREGKVGGGARAGLDGLALAAVSEATGRTVDEVRELVKKGAGGKGVTQAAFLAALTTSKLVEPILARMRQEARAGLGEVDGDGLLGEMMGG